MASSSTRSSRRLLAERRGRGAGDPAGTRRLLPRARRRTFSRSDPGSPAVPADQCIAMPSGHRPPWHGRWVLPDRRALRARRGRRFAGRRTAARRRGQERIGAGGGAELALRRLAHELAHASPGGAIVIQHLGHIMLVEMLRLYLERGGDGAPSWLLAVSDRASARRSRRSTPIRARLDRRGAGRGRGRIALHAGLCISSAGGHRAAGILRWRMQLAARALTGSQATISSVAQKLGYDSGQRVQPCLRVSGSAPSVYRRPPVPPDGQQGVDRAGGFRVPRARRAQAGSFSSIPMRDVVFHVFSVTALKPCAP